MFFVSSMHRSTPQLIQCTLESLDSDCHSLCPKKKLYLLDFAQLISRAHQTPVKKIETKEETILQSSDSRIGFGSSCTSFPRSGDSEHDGRDADEPPLRLSCPSPDSEVRSQDPTDSGVSHGIHVEDSDLGRSFQGSEDSIRGRDSLRSGDHAAGRVGSGQDRIWRSQEGSDLCQSPRGQSPVSYTHLTLPTKLEV